jgi:hypothetical protein
MRLTQNLGLEYIYICFIHTYIINMSLKYKTDALYIYNAGASRQSQFTLNLDQCCGSGPGSAWIHLVGWIWYGSRRAIMIEHRKIEKSGETCFEQNRFFSTVKL